MPDQHRRVKELFLEARSLPSDERAAWLEAACADASERAEVESLLAAERDSPSDYLMPQYDSGMAPGVRVGRYRILDQLGAGGMGEVWLARDETLGRRVALKFPAEGLMGGHFGRRVRREARIAASLDHHAVCRVFELGEADGRSFIVMEYLQGDTLAERVRHRPIPLDQALAWAVAVASAVEQAHDKGLIHRDLKPANVMVTRSGQVKVMDFGLASVTPAGAGDGAGGSGEESGPSRSGGGKMGWTEPHGTGSWQTDSGEPRSGDAATGGTGSDDTGGTSAADRMVGTPPYMAPEQLRGRPTDQRADIWAFGCVLYEMLTGRRAFGGGTVPEVVAAILEREPDWEELPESTPPEVRRLLGRCLRKDPGQRLRHIGDAGLVLEEALRGDPAPGSPVGVGPSDPAARGWRSVGVRGAALFLFAVAAGLAAWSTLRPGASPGETAVHASISLPSGVRVLRAGLIAPSVALSPDGRTLATAATGEDGQRIWVRFLHRREALPLAGTENGVAPFFSPDGAWIGFFADGRLRRVPAAGGAAVDIAFAPGFPLGATWGVDDRIIFATGARSALHVVSAEGGVPERLTTLDAEGGEVSHRHPELLADGRTLLFTSLSPAGPFVHALDLRSGRRAEVTRGATPQFVPGGYVTVNRGSDLLVAAFDPRRLELAGSVVPVVQGVAAEASHTMHYAVSRDGILAYVPAGTRHALVIVQDEVEEIVDERPRTSARPVRPRFSPDGAQLALGAGVPSEVWIHDLGTGAATRLTFDGGSSPVWTRDGDSVTFVVSPFHGTAPDRPGLHTKPVDGRSGSQPLLPLDDWHRPIGWTPDGQMLAFEAFRGDAIPSIWVLEKGEVRRVLSDGYAGRLSPDGRWLAYHSEAVGGPEVYVTPFPEADARWQISTRGGSGAAWSADGAEVYYRSGDRLMAARIETGAGVRVTSRRVVLERFAPSWPDDYDVHPQGQGLVLVRPSEEPGDGEVAIVVDFAGELARLRQ